MSSSASPSPSFGLAPGGGLAAGIESELEELLTAQPAEFLRRLPGRDTFAARLGQRPVVVKRFHTPPRILASKGGARPARREFDALVDLADRGLPVPRPLAWIQAGPASALVMEHVPHERHLGERLAEEPGAWVRYRRELLRLVTRLHGRAGAVAWHRDLYLAHFLVSEPDGGLVLIDVGRVRNASRVRRRWLEKDLAALAHSCPPAIGPRARLAWLDAWLRRCRGCLPRPAARARLLRWARAIERRRARMARHVPRHGEAGDLDPS
ncbi:MAG: lipopolysaccharide kinase InaA family protein [Planctomycetota bacterium]